MYRVLLLSVALMAAAACGPGKVASVGSSSQAILGGTEVSGGIYRAIVYLQTIGNHNTGVCTGTFVTDSLILSAAHCVRCPLTGPAMGCTCRYAGQKATDQENPCGASNPCETGFACSSNGGCYPPQCIGHETEQLSGWTKGVYAFTRYPDYVSVDYAWFPAMGDVVVLHSTTRLSESDPGAQPIPLVNPLPTVPPVLHPVTKDGEVPLYHGTPVEMVGFSARTEKQNPLRGVGTITRSNIEHIVVAGATQGARS